MHHVYKDLVYLGVVVLALFAVFFIIEIAMNRRKKRSQLAEAKPISMDDANPRV